MLLLRLDQNLHTLGCFQGDTRQNIGTLLVWLRKVQIDCSLGDHLQGDTHTIFRLNADELLERPFFIKADMVSLVDLAVSWRAYQDNLQHSTVRRIQDISINYVLETGPEMCQYIRLSAFLVCTLQFFARDWSVL